MNERMYIPSIPNSTLDNNNDISIVQYRRINKSASVQQAKRKLIDPELSNYTKWQIDKPPSIGQSAHDL